MIAQFTSCRKRKVEAKFSGGAVTSDGGAVLLREIDRVVGLTSAVARKLKDERRKGSCEHDLKTLLRQRVYGIALGYEDLNDHQELRTDPCFQTALGRAEVLASAPTLCRFENRADRELAWAIHKILVEKFIASFKAPPKELVLDFDATDDRVHGTQEGRFFHGYYGDYCFLPLYVYAGEQLLVSYLRPSNQDGAKHAGVVLRLLVKQLRQAWPKVKITWRADSGFCRWRVLSWCERHNVQYIVGIAKNARLLEASQRLMLRAERQYKSTGEKQRIFSEFEYAAEPWDHPRRIIAKAEYSALGSNPRYLVTNISGDAQQLYDELYCARGEMENRIKEAQLAMFADRTSCHRWWPNQFRLLLSGLAYVLVESLRRLALPGTALARARADTIRLKLFKIGAVVIRNTKRVRLLVSSHYPYQELFARVAQKLTST